MRRVPLAHVLAYVLAAPLLAASPPVAAADPPGRDDDYAACMALAGRAPEAALARSEAMWKTGEHGAARHCLATALLSMGRSDEAAKVLDDLAQGMAAPHVAERAEVLAQAGRAWLDAGLAGRAVASYTRALAATPDDTRLLIERAVALGAADRDFEALDDLNRAIELNPASAEAHALRGAAYRRVGALELAFENLSAALNLDPDHAEAWLELGLLYASHGDPVEARRALDRVITLDGAGAAGQSARAALRRLDGAREPGPASPRR